MMLQKYIAHNSLLPFYLAWQLDSGSNYNLCFSYELESCKYANLLIEKLQKLVMLKAHLRQTFTLEGNKLVVSIHQDLPAEINFFTTTRTDFAELEQVLVKQQHDISSKSSVRLNVINFSDNSHCIILFNIHHIIMDGYSINAFIIDLNRLMANEEVGHETTAELITRIGSEPALQEDIESGLTQYIKEVNDIASRIDYPMASNKNNVWHYKENLPDYITENLIILSKQENISIFNLLLLTWSIFTAKLFNQCDVLVNYPVNIRKDKSLNGCFINLATFPLSFTVEDTFLSLIHKWHQKITIFKHAAKVKLNDKLNVNFIPSFAYSNFAMPHELCIHSKCYSVKTYPQIANSNLSVKYHERESKFSFSCDILAEVLPQYLTSSLLTRFFSFLNRLLMNSNVLLSSSDLMFDEEKLKVLHHFNDTFAPYPQDKSIQQLFEEMVLKNPDSPALIYGGKKLTYMELNEHANQLAHYLKDYYNIQPDDLVALCLGRNEHMLIAILAVLKAGGAYVPLDPGYPDERVGFILNDTKTKLLLTNEIHRARLEAIRFSDKTNVIAIDNKEFAHELSLQRRDNLLNNNQPDSLAYVIYTSGTTGKPKGVMIEHKNVTSFISNFLDYPLTRETALNMLSTTNYVFDIFGLEYLLPLFNGYSLELLDLTDLSTEVNLCKYDCIQITPAKLELLIERINYNITNSVEHKIIMLIGGEAVSQTTLNRIYELKEHLSAHKQHVNFVVINVYGPTEATIWSAATQLEYSQDNRFTQISIGKPLHNETMYVLDRNQNLLPVGAIGELYIGGDGLARGYLNQTQLTKERFIINPFQTEVEKNTNRNSRLYKTGDLVRWLPNGHLEYITRNDFQVKIRGYRIELGEIENTLARYPKIKQAVVLAKDGIDSTGKPTSDKYLVAYYVTESKLDELKLQEYLAAQLPEYMVPSVFMHLNKLPLTINGKLDRKALPNPELTKHDEYIPPRNEQEQLICKAFAKVLCLERIGINDDFFKIGGNSLKAITLTSALQANFDINVADIFNLRTPKQLAQNAHFGKNILKRKLEQVKLFYENNEIKNAIPEPDERVQDKVNQYLAAIHNLPSNYRQQKHVNCILLTGATGYLGCNLLNQLLNTTDYHIFLLVRAESNKEAFIRLNKKFQFYFGKPLRQLQGVRISVFAADIEKPDLGLSALDYQDLLLRADSVIHSAALTKHYGEYDKFYSANVQATVNLLEFSKLAKLKDFHYISTSSVLSEGYLPHYHQYLFTEDDTAENLEGRSNVYVKTKYEGEKEVIRYREYGVNTNIYRVGNLALISTNGQAQENIDDNGFFNRLKCFLKLRVVAQEIGLEEISPVDLTAQAIIKLFDREQLNNQIYHVFNPNLFNMADFFLQDISWAVKVVPIKKFIDTIVKHLDDPASQKLIERFLLHQGWLNEWHINSTTIRISQERTQYILKQLGFEWVPITNIVFSSYLKMDIKHDKKS